MITKRKDILCKKKKEHVSDDFRLLFFSVGAHMLANAYLEFGCHNGQKIFINIGFCFGSIRPTLILFKH